MGGLNSPTILQEAAQRNLDFILGIYADPIFLGDYPASVRERVPDLPRFTAEQAASLKGSADYFALNHYTTRYVSHDDARIPSGVATHTQRNGKACLLHPLPPCSVLLDSDSSSSAVHSAPID